VPSPWRNVSLHYVALGDSTTVGVGDPMNGSSTTDLSGAGARPGEGWRGWANDLVPWAARMAVTQFRPSPSQLALPPSTSSEVQRLEA
jgi:hypothetical protein